MIKNYIRQIRQIFFRLLFRFSAKQFSPSSDKKILVLAPHPDDETFGCGGLIASKIKQGSEVYILFFTRGERSLSFVDDKEVKEKRTESAYMAAKILGIDEKNISWLDCPDGSIPRKGQVEFDKMKKEVEQIIDENEIAEIFAPHFMEGWSDHLAAYKAATDIAKRYDGQVTLYLYWVWAWYYVGLKQIFTLPWKRIYLLAIEDVYNKKEAAIQSYLTDKTPKGDLYVGNLPAVFLKAFEWKYELFEKVDLNAV